MTLSITGSGTISSGTSFNTNEFVQFVGGNVVETKKKKGLFDILFNRKDSKKYGIDEFFTLIKNGLQETDYKKALKYKKEIISQLLQAEKLGQTSMIEKLNSQLVGFKKEITIISKGFNKYVFESDIADLEAVGIEGRTIYRKDVRNYVGIIPKEVVKNIVKAKPLFDEIIILFTRKRGRELALDKKKSTTNSKREKVDPICFGRVNETGRLFIIGDWMDDECDFDAKKLQGLVDIKNF